MRRDGGWGPMLRLAWRDSFRAKGRSALVLVLIALPVVGVVAADVIIATSKITGTEALERRLGSGEALVTFTGMDARVFQAFDPQDGNAVLDTAEGSNEHTSLADVGRALGRPVEGIEWSTYSVNVRTRRGGVDGTLNLLDATSPLAAGAFTVTEGRLPERAGEVSINGALAGKGFAVGDRVALDEYGAATVVGIGEGTWRSEAELLASAGTFDMPPTSGSWLIGGAPVSWGDVLALNERGATVISRDVLTNPPPDSALPREVRMAESSVRDSLLPVIVLIAVMALIEVVLLAGPAFAVTARRQSRALALMVASGGTPRQARRVVLGTGVVLGGLAALAGLMLGVVIARLGLPLAQRTSPTWFGPFDVPWRHAVIVAGFGSASAVLAALVPAMIASRQDVVAVLAGRRGDRATSRRSPVVGVVLMGAAIALAAYGSHQRGTQGAYSVAIAAIVAVLAMVLLVPTVVVVVSRLAGRLPLSLRFAARDAARHRTRTVPAVAAVAATVAGVVALGVAMASDQARARAEYDAAFAEGWGSVQFYGETVDWGQVTRVAREAAPGALVYRVNGAGVTADQEVDFAIPHHSHNFELSFDSRLGSEIVVADDPALVRAMAGLDDAARRRARAVLARGGVVLFTGEPIAETTVRLRARRVSDEERPDRWRAADLPAVYVTSVRTASVLAMVSPAAAEAVGLVLEPTALLLDARELTPAQQTDLTEQMRGLSTDLVVYVERGFQQDPGVRIVYLVLAALAGVLMLGGTLTTTFLALSDARPDLATLSAVGAPPRRRRTVAASYAVVVGLLGAVLGVVVGLIPGIAIARPLTAGYLEKPGVADHYLAIPWLLIGLLVVALPLLTALAVGLAARSRLPMVARLT